MFYIKILSNASFYLGNTIIGWLTLRIIGVLSFCLLQSRRDVSTALDMTRTGNIHSFAGYG